MRRSCRSVPRAKDLADVRWESKGQTFVFGPNFGNRLTKNRAENKMRLERSAKVCISARAFKKDQQSIYLQKSASIQLRTSAEKFARSSSPDAAEHARAPSVGGGTRQRPVGTHAAILVCVLGGEERKLTAPNAQCDRAKYHERGATGAFRLMKYRTESAYIVFGQS